MIESKFPREEENHQREFAAEEGKNQRVGHRAHHVAADIHAGFEQILSGQRRISGVDFLQGRGDAHGHVHDGTQRADDDARHQQAFQLDRHSSIIQLEQRFRIF